MDVDRITPGQEVVVELRRSALIAIARVERKGVTMRNRRGKHVRSGVQVVTTEDAPAVGGGVLPAGHRQVIRPRDVRESATDDWRRNVRWRVQQRGDTQRVQAALRAKGVDARVRGGEVTMSVQDAQRLAGE